MIGEEQNITGKGENTVTEEQLIQCLKDAGCDKKTITSCCSCLSQDEKQRLEQLIKKHRCELVCKMHEDQKMIDCLDYLMYQLKKERKE